MSSRRPQSLPLARPARPSRRPVGQVTRGKTAQNRLRRVDLLLARYDPDVLRREEGEFAGAWLVDLGFGAEPFTTLEMAARLRSLNPALRVLGVEIDPERVQAALPYADEHTEFRLGGFNLPINMAAGERVRAVRAFNVLRQYDEEQVAGAYAELARGVLPGGLLVEGTSDPYGRVWVANVVRRTGAASAGVGLGSARPDGGGQSRAGHSSAGQSSAGQSSAGQTSAGQSSAGQTSAGQSSAAPDISRPGWNPGSEWDAEALVFSTNFRTGFDPAQFQPVLPKNCIHRMVPGEPIYALVEAWKDAARRTAPERAWGLRAWFRASAHALAATGVPVELRNRWLDHGFLIVRHPWSGRNHRTG